MRDKIGSALEKHRESLRSPVIDGEKFVARCQASFDGGNLMFASWKPGFLYLTPTRLLFYQGDNQLLEIPLVSVRHVGIVQGRWVSKKTCDQLALTKETPRGTRTIHLRIDPLQQLEKWHGLIEGQTEEVCEDDDRRPERMPRPRDPKTGRFVARTHAG